ncbi:hypothetical protein GQ53DRAFT_845294 [Thozetella sp. PMI_491]|nr:hypothetical protein GQ53DRAFT_845294 [Thozetella sp. PMI_491]
MFDRLGTPGLDGATGTVQQFTRILDPPFQSADSQCGDIPNTIGITGTPIIDPATDIMYFYSKGYKNGAAGGGTINGQYKLYAVKLPNLQDVPGFPVSLEGTAASNDDTRYFGSKTSIWQSGMGLAVDSAKSYVYFATGNSCGPGDLKGSNGVPMTSNTKISTLEQTVAAFAVDRSGGLSQQDWFCPVDYDSLSSGDRDFGSSGVALLDLAAFSGGGVNRIGVASGKNGKVYIMDANNLGGFRMGSGQTDGGVYDMYEITRRFRQFQIALHHSATLNTTLVMRSPFNISFLAYTGEMGNIMMGYLIFSGAILMVIREVPNGKYRLI